MFAPKQTVLSCFFAVVVHIVRGANEAICLCCVHCFRERGFTFAPGLDIFVKPGGVRTDTCACRPELRSRFKFEFLPA